MSLSTKKIQQVLEGYPQKNGDEWTKSNFNNFLTIQIRDNTIDKPLFYMDKVLSMKEIEYIINNTAANENTKQQIIRDIPNYIKAYGVYLEEFENAKDSISAETMQTFQIYDDDIESNFLSELNNPYTYTSMNTVNTFILDKIGTPYFIANIPILIDKIKECISDKREIKIQDIVDIKKMTKKNPQFALLDKAMDDIIRNLLASMVVSCEQIKFCINILFTRLPIENIVEEAWWYNENVEDVFSSNDKERIKIFKKTTTINDIQKSFDLIPNTYILGRFGSSKPDPPINKIPVFSSTHPFIESRNHAILTVDDDKQNVTIQNMEKHNGTFILRDDVTIKVRGNKTYRLFTNDVIRMGPGLIANRKGIKTENDAKYKLNIPNPTTIILNGFIECSVGDAQSLMDSIVKGGDRFKYNECIYNDQHFKNPNSQREGGGPAYITIAGRRRKIHIQKGKQYVNYKSELILVSKLKKIIK
jgi:hypothetical protein